MVTTIVALENGLVEANPIVAGIISKGGYVGFIAFKFLVAYILNDIKENNPGAAPLVGAVNIATCGAALWNLSLL